MGLHVTVYLTDATQIKALYGSKDKGLLAQLLDELEDEIDGLNEYFEDDLSDGENGQEVLRDIINGNVRFPHLAFLYGYIYMNLCQYYGEFLESPNEEYSVDYFYAVPKLNDKVFIPIPIPEDFPEIYSIPLTNLYAEKESFFLTTIDNVNIENLKNEQENYCFAFDQALKSKKDLAFFIF